MVDSLHLKPIGRGFDSLGFFIHLILLPIPVAARSKA